MRPPQFFSPVICQSRGLARPALHSTLAHTCARTLHVYGTMVPRSFSPSRTVTSQMWAATCPSAAQGVRGPAEGSYTSPPPLLGAAIPPHHLINTASPYTLEKKPLKRCNVGEGLRRGVQQHMMLQGSNIHMNKPAWASLLQGQSGVAELKQIVERTRTISGCSKCHCGSITSASCDTPSPHPSSSGAGQDK